MRRALTAQTLKKQHDAPFEDALSTAFEGVKIYSKHINSPCHIAKRWCIIGAYDGMNGRICGERDQ